MPDSTPSKSAGRPALPPEQRRTACVRVLLTPAEHAALADLAGRRQLSNYVRTLIRRHLRRTGSLS